jgi:hypothetical protein
MRQGFLILFILGFAGQLFSQKIVGGPVIGAVTDHSARIMLQYDMPGTYQIELMAGFLETDQKYNITVTADKNNI